MTIEQLAEIRIKHTGENYNIVMLKIRWKQFKNRLQSLMIDIGTGMT